MSIFTLGFISIFLNFIFPINKLISNLVFLFPLIIFIFFIKNVFNSRLLLTVFIITTISFFTITLSNVYTPDSGLYHLPYTKIINENKIIIGITNINFTLGQNSLFQYIAAIYNNSIFGDSGVTIPLVQLFSFIIFTFAYYLIKNKEITLTYFIIFLITCFCLLRLNRYSDFGNDGPAHLLFFFQIFLVLNILKKNDFSNFDYFQTNIVSILTFTIKPTLIFIFFINFFLIFKFKFFKFLRYPQSYFFLIILLGFFVKNILVSGCLLYPIEVTCSDKYPWYSNNISYHGNSERVHDQGQAWTKGFPDHPKPQKSFKEYNKGFYWMTIWKKNHGIVIVKKFLPLGFLFLILISLNLFLKKRGYEKNLKFVDIKNSDFFFLLLFLFISSLYWFFNFPVLRYGLSIIGSFILLLFTYFIKNNFYMNFKHIQVFLIALCLIVMGKNFSRIKNNYNEKYLMYPWPKIYNEKNSSNQKMSRISIMRNDKFYFFVPKDQTLCFFNASPCTHFNTGKILSEIKLTKIFNYNAFYVKKK